MRVIKEAIDDLQVACMRPNVNTLGDARIKLIASFRQCLVEVGATDKYLAEYDKNLSPK